ncbi:hypothetical protein GPECTOR_11g206 [Gonium pectorale]|uniref:Uncharacterized protein n=1 Tax=Gonium pectorale TaxID=33097 RepID=A0A150GPU5_GONPE|nr:hypothetical protein GPECTOR_11g206 [Gonium pectorale]|eukprot:KXZ51762.1 hypothetical protein GPECTOR_11g206 [Gonium pectorale]
MHVFCCMPCVVQVSYIISASGIPWAVKPLIGMLSDTVPLWGYRRKSYLVASGLGGALSWLLLCLAARSRSGALGPILLTSAASAVSDVVVDSMVVERARREKLADSGSLQSLCWAAYAVGQVGSAYWSGSLVEQLGARAVFALTALMPLLVLLVGLRVREERGPGVIALLRRLCADEGAGRDSAACGGGGRCGDDGVMADGGKGPGVGGGGRSAVGEARPLQRLPVSDLDEDPGGRVGVYHALLRRRPLRCVLLWGTLLCAACQASSLVLVTRANVALGLDDHWFALGDSVSVIQYVLFMPTMVLAARLCPPGMEATLFATLMSIGNIAWGVRYMLGASLMQLLGVTATDFRRLPLFIAICNIALLLPLPLLLLVPRQLDSDPEPAPGDTAGNGTDEGKAHGGGQEEAGPGPGGLGAGVDGSDGIGGEGSGAAVAEGPAGRGGGEAHGPWWGLGMHHRRHEVGATATDAAAAFRDPGVIDVQAESSSPSPGPRGSRPSTPSACGGGKEAHAAFGSRAAAWASADELDPRSTGVLATSV